MNSVHKLSFKDGEDDDLLTIGTVTINTVSNGWIVTYETDEEECIQEVYTAKEGLTMLAEIAKTMGIT